MRRRRLVTALMAVVLAALGATLLTHYVRGADERALGGLATVDVLVVTRPVPQGTAAADLGGSVTTRALPQMAVAPGTLTSLQDAGGRVAASDLAPGEQLLDAKFVDPASLQEADEVPVPAGLQEVTVSLERQRMLGSALVAGARVGVFISLPQDGDTPARTKLAVPRVLVTSVGEPEAGPVLDPGDADAEVDAAAPAESVTVRLAVGTDDAEKVVFGAEHGRLWLSRQPDDVPTTEPPVMTAERVYR
jgi:pilus assembly protein CpaB